MYGKVIISGGILHNFREDEEVCMLIQQTNGDVTIMKPKFYIIPPSLSEE
jgi:hypothetical protein